MTANPHNRFHEYTNNHEGHETIGSKVFVIFASFGPW
jgi:hypothetical protein